MPGGGRTAAGANRLHGEELQPTIFAEQVRLADRKSDRPLGSLKITCVPFCAATVPSYSPAESTTSAPAFRHLWPRAPALRAAPGAFRSFREPLRRPRHPLLSSPAIRLRRRARDLLLPVQVPNPLALSFEGLALRVVFKSGFRIL